MTMTTAKVVGAGVVRHPESNVDRMRITVDHPYAQGGQFYGLTDIWGQRDMPVPQNDDPIAWGARHILYKGVLYAKPEYDSNPADPLH